ncbi:polymer-forming cytoskeletal [bacterium BMS3Bbin06]|nr:polymer-forming cytoskeletal [bacterium BMS3Abin08]GBE34672.1 polymer-forming cytoskeletal [bacterium BMS3Bbin06]HDO35826.1 polymer-forming cytoskeletal protein [Nitrospirota bacterium]HDY70409.1 polymer-forming cytoskeletal protein [Nitrospirota bacterium]
MFNKKYDKIETIVGFNSTIKGEVHVKGTLRTDGMIEGNVKADWVVVGQKGRVKGNIHAMGVLVGGSIEGNIEAKESVEIKSKGYICGDIRTQKLIIIEGGIFDGYSIMKKEEKKVVELQKGQQGPE